MNIKPIEAKWNEKRSHWRVDIQKEGVRKTFYSNIEGRKGKKEAETKAKLWFNKDIVAFDIRFHQAFDKFLDETSLLTSVSNVKKHESIAKNHLLPLLEHKKLSNITTNDFQSCINEAYKKGLSKKTLQNIRGTITCFVSFCLDCNYDIQPLRNIRIPKTAPSKEKIILQPEKLSLIFDENEINNKEFYIHAFRFMILTGLRRGELCGLKKSDIKDKIVTIHRSINSLQEITDGKTQNAKRQFMLSVKAEECLHKQSELLKSRCIISPYVFPNTKGNVTNTQMLFSHWREYRSKIGVSCSLHELRHTFISIGQADIPEQLLKRIVGHSKSMDTFGIYGHNVDGDLERVAHIVDDTFDRLL